MSNPNTTPLNEQEVQQTTQNNRCCDEHLGSGVALARGMLFSELFGEDGDEDTSIEAEISRIIKPIGNMLKKVVDYQLDD